MILGAIDVGTNSVKLLIVDSKRGRLVPVAERVTITRLGEGVEKTRRISAEAMDRTLEALVGFRELARRRRAWTLEAVGTRVLRMAENAGDFVRRCRKELDLPVRILSGEEEARLGYVGATGGSESCAVLDVGGGSAQLIVRGRGRSVDVGAVVLTEAFLRTDPPRPEELRAARDRAARELRGLVRGRKLPSDLVGIGGTIATAAAIRRRRKIGPEAAHGCRLPLRSVDALRDRLAAMTIGERRRVRGLDPARADIIVAGLVVVGEAMRAGGFEELRTSAYGLRHGLALEMATRV